MTSRIKERNLVEGEGVEAFYVSFIKINPFKDPA
jgi:hypothetical protein